MGLFSRIGTLFKSNINDLISKSEDPEKMLNQVVLDMQNQLIEAKKQVAVSIADQKRLEKQRDEQGDLAKSGNARPCWRCARATRPWRARRSSAKPSTTAQFAEFGKQAQLQKDAVDKLKDQLRALNDKIEEAKRKKNILIARQKRAEAQKTIQSTMRGSPTPAPSTPSSACRKRWTRSRPRPRRRRNWATS